MSTFTKIPKVAEAEIVLEYHEVGDCFRLRNGLMCRLEEIVSVDEYTLRVVSDTYYDAANFPKELRVNQLFTAKCDGLVKDRFSRSPIDITSVIRKIK